MPELPEVETVVRGLRSVLPGREIDEIASYRDGTVHDERSGEGEYGKVTGIRRRGKYILIDTDNGMTVMVHLRMTGKLVFNQPVEESKHCRAEVKFIDQTNLVFDDVRTFGKIILLDTGDEEGKLLSLGPEPLEDDFNEQYLAEKLSGRSVPIKNALLDQRVTAGLGNIYVAEILHRAGISPLRESRSMNKSEISLIIYKTKEVLREAVAKNGTTISDYRSIDDKTGEFQRFLRVYGKKQCHCGSEIKRVKQAGRTTFYCPVCQK
jgi:formamidopyrimidine-DNA glycosylase